MPVHPPVHSPILLPRLRRGLLLGASVTIASALHGCTAIILSDADSADAPCSDADECASGSRCEDGACVADDRDPGLPGSPTRVGPDGGTVPGPDGVLLTFPAGALDANLDFEIERASSTIVLDALEARSRFYRIGPDVPLDAPATLSIPLEEACPACAVFRQASDGFVELAVVSGPAGAVSCATATLGLFVVAEESP